MLLQLLAWAKVPTRVSQPGAASTCLPPSKATKSSSSDLPQHSLIYLLSTHLSIAPPGGFFLSKHTFDIKTDRKNILVTTGNVEEWLAVKMGQLLMYMSPSFVKQIRVIRLNLEPVTWGSNACSQFFSNSLSSLD